MSTTQIESLRSIWRKAAAQHERTVAALRKHDPMASTWASGIMLAEIASEIKAQAASLATDLTDEIDADIRRLA